MKVLIDTSIWSEVLRRREAAASKYSPDVRELIDEGRVVMLGPVRQELLSGVRADSQFKKLRDMLRAFPDHAIDTGDYEKAAVCFNKCRRKGIQGSHTDFLICAIALRGPFEVFTSDRDFDNYRKALRLRQYKPRFSKQ